MWNNEVFNRAVPITTSDTVNIHAGLTDAVHVGGAGTVTAVFENNEAVQVTAAAGDILPIKVKRINATGTAATLLVALYQV